MRPVGQGSCQTVRTSVFTMALRPAPLAKAKPPRKDLNNAETGSLSESCDFDFESVAPTELNEECLEWASVFAVLLCCLFLCSFFPGYVLHFVHLLISKLWIALPFPIRQRSWTPPRFVPRTPPGPPPPTPPDILGMVPRTPPLLSPPAPSQLLGSPPRTPESQWAHTL